MQDRVNPNSLNSAVPVEHLVSAHRLGKESLTFLAGSVFTFLVGFPLQIFVARTLGAAELGLFGIYEAAMMSAADVLSIGIATVLVRFIPQYLEEKRYADLRRLIRTCLLVLTIIGLAGLTGAVLVGHLWWARLGLTPDHRLAYFVATLIIPLSLVTFALSQALRGFLEVRQIVLGQNVLQLLLKAVIAVVLLTAGCGIAGFVIAVVVANLFAAVWLSWHLWRRVNQLPQEQAGPLASAPRDWFPYAGFNYLMILLGAAGARFDRFALGYFTSVASVGIAIAVTSLNNLPSIFLRVLLAAAGPMFTQMHAKGDRDGLLYLYRMTTDWVLRAILPFSIYLMAFSEPLLNLYGEGFSNTGARALAILACGQIINAAAGPVGAMLNASGGEKTVFAMTALGTVTNIASLLFLVPRYGLLGWAIANLLINLLHAAMGAAMLKKHFGASWWSARYAKWLVPAIGTTAVAAAVAQAIPPSGVISLLTTLMLCYGVFVSLMCAAGLNSEDRALARALWQKITSFHSP